jgi:hypothetical protein
MGQKDVIKILPVPKLEGENLNRWLKENQQDVELNILKMVGSTLRDSSTSENKLLGTFQTESTQQSLSSFAHLDLLQRSTSLEHIRSERQLLSESVSYPFVRPETKS